MLCVILCFIALPTRRLTECFFFFLKDPPPPEISSLPPPHALPTSPKARREPLAAARELDDACLAQCAQLLGRAAQVEPLVAFVPVALADELHQPRVSLRPAPVEIGRAHV